MRTLTAWILRVKQARGELVSAVLAGVLVALGVVAIATEERDASADAQALGEQLAAGLAQLAVEPLSTRDRIALGVLANRVVEVKRVRGATIYTVDNDVLAISGEPKRGTHVIAPITQNNNIVGYVRVTLGEPASAPATSGLWLSLLIGLLIPPLVVALRHLPWQAVVAPRPTAAATGPGPPEPELPPPPTSELRPLLAVNLFNQLSLPPRIRDAELGRAVRLADAVTDLYSGRVATLPGTGVLLEFEGGQDPERPFQVLCAAFLLARLLNTDDEPGQFRFGLHQAELPGGDDLAPDDPVVQDAALLSAVARPGSIVVSDELFDRVARPERLRSEHLSNPLLHQLESTEPSAWLVSALDEPHDGVIEQQARELGYSAPATESASTF